MPKMRDRTTERASYLERKSVRLVFVALMHCTDQVNIVAADCATIKGLPYAGTGGERGFVRPAHFCAMIMAVVLRRGKW